MLLLPSDKLSFIQPKGMSDMSYLSTRFARNRSELRSNAPLTGEQIQKVAPSIFTADKHQSRSDRYAHIPTGVVLRGLRKEGFSPFMVCQSRTRDESKREHTKHMVRLRHATQIGSSESNEIILINSHDGASSYQMLAGAFRFVCANGLVCGDVQTDIRVRHSGNVMDNVIDGAFNVLKGFDEVDGQRCGMKGLELNRGEKDAFANAALALRYDTELSPAPITENQLLGARRMDDQGDDLWSTFNRVQENMLRGGLTGRTAAGQRTTTRAVTGIDQGIKLNRALWVLAESMRALKSAI
jgi:Domain of unknown function (DUF932)